MKESIKSVLKNLNFSFILGIIIFVIGCLFVLISKGNILKTRLLISLIGFIPFIIFLSIIMIKKKFVIEKNKNSFNTIIFFLLPLFFLYYFVSIYICVIIEAINPITDIKFYKNKIKGTELLKVFPKEIPTDVENIKFYYAPGILQGGTEYILSYTDKNLSFEEFDLKYKKMAIWIGYKEEYTENNGLITGIFSNAIVEYKNENDYIIYLIEGKCDNSGYCNHGDYLFAAFNEKTNEVIYKSEQW